MNLNCHNMVYANGFLAEQQRESTSDTPFDARLPGASSALLTMKSPCHLRLRTRNQHRVPQAISLRHLGLTLEKTSNGQS